MSNVLTSRQIRRRALLAAGMGVVAIGIWTYAPSTWTAVGAGLGAGAVAVGVMTAIRAGGRRA